MAKVLNNCRAKGAALYQVGRSCWGSHTNKEQQVLLGLQGHTTFLGNRGTTSANAPEPPRLPTPRFTLPSPCRLSIRHLALAQANQRGDQVALPNPPIRLLGLNRQLGGQSLSATGTPVRSLSVGVVLVLNTGRLSRQGGGFFGCLFLSRSLLTLQMRLNEARSWWSPLPMLSPGNVGCVDC